MASTRVGPADTSIGIRVLWAVTWIAIVAGVVLRFWTSSHLWLDEVLSVNTARLPLTRIPDALRHDGAPPLYYLLLHLWMKLFGTGDHAVRALSGVFSVLTIPAMWAAAGRLRGRHGAVAGVVLVATSPFAVRYATETRMYSLVALLVVLAFLSIARVLTKATLANRAALAATCGALLLTHYWAIYLEAMVGMVLVIRAVRRRPDRRPIQALVAMAVGGLAFLPWLPIFLFQTAHTGAPWGVAPTIGSVLDTIESFAGGGPTAGPVLFVVLFALIALGFFGRQVDARRIELDLHGRPLARPIAGAAIGTLFLGVAVSNLTGAAYAPRYAAIVFPLVLLLAAMGTAALGSPAVRGGVLAAAAVLGVAGGAALNAAPRTRAHIVAAALRDYAQPGDVIGYCPDQLGPAVARLLPAGMTQLTFPDGARPERVNWVDYRRRVHAVAPSSFAETLLTRAGADHDIWLVSSYGYRSLGSRCTTMVEALAAARPDWTRVVPIKTGPYEHPGLALFPHS